MNKPFFTEKPSDFRKHWLIGIGGQSGAGKTTMAGLAGKDAKVLVLDLEGGSAAYTSKWFREHPDASEIDVVPMYSTEYNDPTRIVNAIIQPMEYLTSTGNKEGYDVVVVDSLTEFQERFIINHPGDNFKKYGDLATAAHKIMQTAQAVPAHVVFTSRVVVREDEVLGREVIRFTLANKAWSVVSGLIDMIGHKTVTQKGFGKTAKDVHVFNTSQTSRFAGKDRSGVGEMEDPTLKKIIETIEGDQ